MLACVLFAYAPAGMAGDTARIEAYPIQTVDATTTQLLRGEAATPEAGRMIAGELRLPSGNAQKLPAVIFLHGDAGQISDQPPWIDELVAAGIAVFTVDSFTGRGVVSASSQIGPLDGTLPSSAARVVDAYRALDVLVHHPRIDPQRIALMGVSSGGRTTLLSAMKRFSGPLARGNARFAAYIALYPPCNVRLDHDERLEAGPVRIFIGASDNITTAASCEAYVARLRKAGVDAAVTVYPGAYHGFDNPAGTTLTDRPDVPGFGGCAFEERDGRIVESATGLPPTESDACVTRGFTAGRNADADGAVRVAVRNLLRTTLAVSP